MTMLQQWTTPGWLLLEAIILWYATLRWRMEAGIEPVEMFGSPLDDQDRTYRRYRLARAAHRIATVLLVAAAVHAWRR